MSVSTPPVNGLSTTALEIVDGPDFTTFLNLALRGNQGVVIFRTPTPGRVRGTGVPTVPTVVELTHVEYKNGSQLFNFVGFNQGRPVAGYYDVNAGSRSYKSGSIALV